jgi:hypothetical protein
MVIKNFLRVSSILGDVPKMSTWAFDQVEMKIKKTGKPIKDLTVDELMGIVSNVRMCDDIIAKSPKVATAPTTTSKH